MNKPMILVIDDQQTIHDTFDLAKICMGIEIIIDHVKSGEDAEKRLIFYRENGKMDSLKVIFIDNDMGLNAMSGSTFLQRNINTLEKHIVSIAMSGISNARTHMLKAGAIRFYDKPFDINQITDEIEKACQIINAL